MSDNTIHKIQISVKAQLGDSESKFENLAVEDLAVADLFVFQ